MQSYTLHNVTRLWVAEHVNICSYNDTFKKKMQRNQIFRCWMTDIVISTRYYRYGCECHYQHHKTYGWFVNPAFPLIVFSAKHLYACLCGIIDTLTLQGLEMTFIFALPLMSHFPDTSKYYNKYGPCMIKPRTNVLAVICVAYI